MHNWLCLAYTDEYMSTLSILYKLSPSTPVTQTSHSHNISSSLFPLSERFKPTLFPISKRFKPTLFSTHLPTHLFPTTHLPPSQTSHSIHHNLPSSPHTSSPYTHSSHRSHNPATNTPATVSMATSSMHTEHITSYLNLKKLSSCLSFRRFLMYSIGKTTSRVRVVHHNIIYSKYVEIYI